jgi:hypothetical protein
MLLALWGGFGLKQWNPGALNDAGSGLLRGYLPSNQDYWDAREGVLKNQKYISGKRKTLSPIILGKAIARENPDLAAMVSTYNFHASHLKDAETHQDYVQLFLKLKKLRAEIDAKLREIS